MSGLFSSKKLTTTAPTRMAVSGSTQQTEAAKARRTAEEGYMKGRSSTDLTGADSKKALGQ